MSKYYIKENLVFSNLTQKIKILDKITEIEVPTTTKSHLINNKILITDIGKILQNPGRNFEITKPIEEFEKIKKEILENKSKLKKITSNDYDFIEKTSAIEIIKSLLNSIENSNLIILENKINEYISKTKNQELQKNTEIEELIEIEKNKIKEIEEKKEEILNNNSVQKLEKLENDKIKLNQEIEKEELNLSKSKNSQNLKLNEILEKQEKINHEIQDLKFKIKINKNKIKSLKAKLKLGKEKQFNWITITLTIISLGLFYWTKYTDTKYYVLKTEEQNANFEEKISRLEHEKFNLEKEIRNENKNKEINENKSNQKGELIRKKIDDLNIKLDKNEKLINEIEDIIKTEDSKIKNYDKELSKIDTKITDLESTKIEFEKYSTLNIKKKLDKLIELKNKNIEELRNIKEKIKSQKIEIKGEYIIEL